MPSTPGPSVLLARAIGLAARAAGMVHAASAPEMRVALRSVELNAREARFWLTEYGHDAAAVRDVEEALTKQSARLDELEDRLRRSAEAKP